MNKTDFEAAMAILDRIQDQPRPTAEQMLIIFTDAMINEPRFRGEVYARHPYSYKADTHKVLITDYDDPIAFEDEWATMPGYVQSLFGYESPLYKNEPMPVGTIRMTFLQYCLTAMEEANNE